MRQLLLLGSRLGLGCWPAATLAFAYGEVIGPRARNREFDLPLRFPVISLAKRTSMANLKSVLSELQSEQKRLEHGLKRIKKAIVILRGLGARSSKRRTRRISAAGRARIAKAQRARWAKVRADKKK